MITDTVIAILIGIIIGVPVSMYAGFVSSRILAFYELRSEAWEIILLSSQPLKSSAQLNGAVAILDRLISVSIKLEAQGHKDARDTIDNVWISLESDLSAKEVTWILLEARGRTNYNPVYTSGAMREARIKIDNLYLSWNAILAPWNHIHKIR
jgi:hypothetical protein